LSAGLIRCVTLTGHLCGTLRGKTCHLKV